MTEVSQEGAEIRPVAKKLTRYMKIFENRFIILIFLYSVSISIFLVIPATINFYETGYNSNPFKGFGLLFSTFVFAIFSIPSLLYLFISKRYSGKMKVFAILPNILGLIILILLLIVGDSVFNSIYEWKNKFLDGVEVKGISLKREKLASPLVVQKNAVTIIGSFKISNNRAPMIVGVSASAQSVSGKLYGACSIGEPVAGKDRSVFFTGDKEFTFYCYVLDNEPSSYIIYLFEKENSIAVHREVVLTEEDF